MNNNEIAASPILIVTAVVATLIMGTVPVLIKSVSANPVTIGLVRLVITVGLMSLILSIFFRSRFSTLRSMSNILGLTAIGVVFGFHWLSYFVSIKMSTASLGAIGVSTFGIHLLILNWLIKGQKISLLNILMIALCFIGCLLVVPEYSLSNSLTVGLCFGVLSGFFYACLPLLHQRVQHIDTVVRVWAQTAFAFLIFLPLSGQSEWNLSGDDWFKLLILGFFCTLVAHSLWVKASTELPGIVTSLIYYLYIPTAVVLSAIFLNEQINIKMIIGGSLILFSNIFQSLLSWRAYNIKMRNV